MSGSQPVGFVYCLVNLWNGKRYIGMATGTPESRIDYFGSSQHPEFVEFIQDVKARHGKKWAGCVDIHMERIILELVFGELEDLRQAEEWHIAHNDATNSFMYYNISRGGTGYLEMNSKLREKIGQSVRDTYRIKTENEIAQINERKKHSLKRMWKIRDPGEKKRIIEKLCDGRREYLRNETEEQKTRRVLNHSRGSKASWKNCANRKEREAEAYSHLKQYYANATNSELELLRQRARLTRRNTNRVKLTRKKNEFIRREKLINAQLLLNSESLIDQHALREVFCVIFDPDGRVYFTNRPSYFHELHVSAPIPKIGKLIRGWSFHEISEELIFNSRNGLFDLKDEEIILHGAAGNHRSKKMLVISPDCSVYLVSNPSQFAAEMGIGRQTLHILARGERMFLKGWMAKYV